MIFRWLKRRRELSARVSAEAETMIALFGDGAYYEARNRALAAERHQLHDPYWARVRREIARRTRRDHVDTATRYLEPEGRIRVWPCERNQLVVAARKTSALWSKDSDRQNT